MYMKVSMVLCYLKLLSTLNSLHIRLIKKKTIIIVEAVYSIPKQFEGNNIALYEGIVSS